MRCCSATITTRTTFDVAGRALLPSVGAVITSVAGAKRVASDARGLERWASTLLEASGRAQKLRRARRRTDAHNPLRRALELADVRSAELAEQVRAKLYAAGGRPRRADGRRIAYRERRIADLALAGRTEVTSRRSFRHSKDRLEPVGQRLSEAGSPQSSPARRSADQVAAVTGWRRAARAKPAMPRFDSADRG